MDASVLVIGGGVTGLTCAFQLARAGHDVRLLEASPQLGGVVQTRRLDGFQFEDGPNTVPGTARHLVELCEELGLQDELLPSRPETKTRYLFHKGGLVALPLKPPQLLRSSLLSARGKLRLLSEPLRPWKNSAVEPSFAEFLSARIGAEAAHRLGGAFVRGIYAAEATELGASSAFPRLYDRAQEHGGLFKALRAARRGDTDGPARDSHHLLSLPGGFEQLIGELERSLGPRVVREAPARGLERDSQGWRVTTPEETVQASSVVLATPAGPTADLLTNHLPPEQLDTLRNLPHGDVTVVHVGLEAERPGDPLIPPGFGFLVPPEAAATGSAPRVLGMLFPSNLFEGRAPEGCAGLSAIYRTADVEDMQQQEDQLVECALQDLERAQGFRPRARVRTSACVRWGRGIPHYGIGHRRRVGELLEAARPLEDLYLFGNWHGGISLDDRIAAGRQAADVLMQKVSA